MRFSLLSLFPLVLVCCGLAASASGPLATNSNNNSTLAAIVNKAIYRGVATDEWAGGCADIAALSRMSWYYNWGLRPNANVANCNLGSRYVEFVPMVWGLRSIPGLLSNVAYPCELTNQKNP